MTRIKLCGLTRPEDIAAANALQPEYIGFVFAPKSRRYVSRELAAELKAQLSPGIQAVGVFVNEAPETVAGLLNAGVIDIAQLHGQEDAGLPCPAAQPERKAALAGLPRDGCRKPWQRRKKPGRPCSAGFRRRRNGRAFDWALLENFKRDYLLAGGLGPENAADAVERLHPYAVDVSSGIETAGKKDPEKMAAFVAAVRKNDQSGKE